ncbi:methionyl-tRNA formyltransferase [Corynebacterium alimapuense]|uniref:Methionyl-tRNA formyltransferase n=1 Tax=Corynebacterium alimapuense TaxID=1576874 RepID=A0A3M8K7L8_9CORY|nr:methionyl-tRNA formyltransferase [Corynebacterium alimapuense]RNE49213.1 methionyl-tRNA formyltransferase [Corynebacterium alimapuense]
MRLIFAGTPEPAVVALRRLIDSEHEILAVITRPDARRGRGRTLHPSPVSALAQEHGIEVLTPSTLKAGTEDGEALRARLIELAPEAIPVVAYGNLVPPDLLDAPTHGWVNLHFSLLPAWRGAAPVQASIKAGDDITGASAFRIEEGLDTGPVLGTVTETIRPSDTADDLLTRLAYSGADLLVATMDGLESGELMAQPQTGEASYAHKISTEDARVDWNTPAFAVDRHIRAHTPGPGAWTMLGDDRIKIGPATMVDGASEELVELDPGQLLVDRKHVLVGTGAGVISLGSVQPPGKKMMAATDWARGNASLQSGEKVSFS